MQIAGKEIGKGRTYIIAELSGNHNQSFELAVETVKAAASTGADAIKLQTYTADTITLDVDLPDFQTRADGLWAGQSLHSLYQKAFTPWEWHADLQKVAIEHGLDFFSSPFDLSAVDFLETLNVPAYKIASFEITDIPLIEYVASKGKPVIISTGIASEEDIRLAIEACYSKNNRQVVLLKCTSEYPAPPERANLNSIKTLKSIFGVEVGLSDHTLGITVPIVSVALGASVIEKHLILDKSLGGVDSAFSLDVTEFKEMVDSVRICEKALGTGQLIYTEEMLKSRRSSRSLYICENVKAGDVISAENIRSVRPGFGLHPKHYHEVLGRKFSRDAEKGTRLSWDIISD